MSPHASVLIVGAGPAGSTLARELARTGYTVRVLDRARFPRPKPCGECINPGAVRLLDRLDLLNPVLREQPAVLSGWQVQADDARPAEGRFGPHFALGLSRSTFDHVLVREARAAGAEIIEGTSVQTIERWGPGWRVHARRGGTAAVCTAGYLVGADGLRSVVARQLGAIARRPRRHKVSFTFHLEGDGPPATHGSLTVNRHGTLGLAPIDRARSRWNATLVVPSGSPATWTARDPWRALNLMFRETRTPWRGEPAVIGGPWTSGPFDWPVRRAAYDRALLIGDASGYFDPFTGQGIYRALRSAELAAACLRSVLERPESERNALDRYAAQWRREVRAPRRLQHLIDDVLAAAVTRRLALGVLRRWPSAMNRIIRVTGDAAPVRSLVLPVVGGP